MADLAESPPHSSGNRDNNEKVNDGALSISVDSLSSDVDVDVDLVALGEEQLKIDSVFNYLLNVDLSKKKVGRPRKRGGKSNASATSQVPTVSKQSDYVGDDYKNITNLNDLHPSYLLEYLVRISKFNKDLLQGMTLLSRKCDCLDEQLKQVNERPVRECERKFTPSADDNVNKEEVEENKSKRYDDLEIRIDDIEQRANANFLLCSGPSIINVLNECSGSLQNNVINEISKLFPEVDENEVIEVTQFGKRKTHVKVECKSPAVRRKLISHARQRKSRDLVFSEFLTAPK